MKSGLSRIEARFAHYLEARKLLRGSISKQSRHGLDWMNFFVADIQLVSAPLSLFILLGWSGPKGQIGLAPSIGTIAGLVANIPSGALVDWASWKRAVDALGIVTQ